MKGTLFRLLRTSFRLLWGWEKLCGPATLRCSNGTTFSKMVFAATAIHITVSLYPLSENACLLARQ